MASLGKLSRGWPRLNNPLAIERGASLLEDHLRRRSGRLGRSGSV
jgi:hypothetical protein